LLNDILTVKDLLQKTPTVTTNAAVQRLAHEAQGTRTYVIKQSFNKLDPFQRGSGEN